MILVENICFYRRDGKQKQAVIDNLSLELKSGEQLALLGDSGSGKTTLLHLLAGLLSPDEGRININGLEISNFNQDQLALYRRSIGLIFQHYQLLPPLTVADNILFQYRLNNPKVSAKKEQLDLLEIASRLGIENKLKALPNELSGGEQQRVGIARALINQPKLILADEPTGNLDQARSLAVVELMIQLCREREINLIMVTHSQQLADYFDQTKYLKNGHLSDSIS